MDDDRRTTGPPASRGVPLRPATRTGQPDPTRIGLPGLLGLLPTQVPAASALLYQREADRRGGGLVLTGADGPASARALTRAGFSSAVLLDRARYAGRRRTVGGQGHDPGWVAVQRRLGLPAVLTDTGYIPQGDGAALAGSLAVARAAGGDVVPVLAVHDSWLNLRERRQELSERVIAADPPAVALVLEKAGDPLGVKRTLSGLLAFLALPVPVLVLRCDGSSIGLLVHGAHTAAVGVTSSLRHLYPETGNGFGPRATLEAVYVRSVASYLKTDKLALGVAANPGDARWACSCPQHAGAPVGDLDDWTTLAQRLHSCATILDERDDAMRVPAHQRPALWRARVTSAVYTHDELRADGVVWPVPPALRHWLDV